MQLLKIGRSAAELILVAIEALREAAGRAIIVVPSSRSGAGFVHRNVEIDDDQPGFVASLDLNPQKARVLAQLLIATHITDAPAVQQAVAER
jgi:L-asparaginase